MSFQGIVEAFQRIDGIANKTPIMTSRTINLLFNTEIYFKCENFQRAGAFKFRGAYNALSLLSDKQRKCGVITHSSGNHAQALALAASLLETEAIIVMPKGAPINKINATKGYNAKVVFCDNTLESRMKTTNELIRKHNFTLIHPYDNDNIINGQGTVAYELIKEIKALDLVIAPLGGGGLLSGTVIATKGLCPKTQVIGVEPSLADDALRSLKAGYIIPSTYPDTIADGLRTSLCQRTFNIIRELVDNIVTISEREILDSMRFLWERMKLIVEPSGAVPLAALMAKKIEVSKKKVGIIISGGNIDLDPFFKLLAYKIQ